MSEENVLYFAPQFMKAMVHHGMEASLVGSLAMEKFAQGAPVQTEDKHAGLAAFLEKRQSGRDASRSTAADRLTADTMACYVLP